MLKVAVRLRRRFDDAGEYLADARALDSIGVDSLWLDEEGHEPWLLLASLAAVTGRIRLGVTVTGEELDTPALEHRLTTLSRLSRSRVVLGFTSEVCRTADIESTVRLARRCDCPVVVPAGGPAEARVAALLADGLIGLNESPEHLVETLAPVRGVLDEVGRKDPFDVWVRMAMPADAGQWRTTRAAYEAAGATGVVVPADPRLLDLLRNGDEEEDRSDLLLAQG